MTRLPSDSFLPSGAMDSELTLSLAGLVGSFPSVVSPLNLPGGGHYLDPASRPSVTSHPPRSNSYRNNNRHHNRDPPQAQPASFLSPHLTPIPSYTRPRLPISNRSQQRACSLSPTRIPADKRRDCTMDRNWEYAHPGPPPGAVPAGRPVSVETISGTGSGLITVRRPAAPAHPVVGDSHPAEQAYRKLEKMRQRFDNERRHLQADRDRAEETHKEIMEEMAKDHDLERALWEADKYELQTHVMQLQKRVQELEQAARSNQRILSCQLSPLEQPSLSPLASLERSSIDSNLATDNQEPSKVIDVQQYHEDLEGIPVKENFVKRETFTDTPSSVGSRNSSGKVSPPTLPENSRSLARSKSILAFRADPTARLTMHAGHTPTVSLSIAHTGTSNTVVSSGSNTPTLVSGDGAMSSDGNDKPESSEPAEPMNTLADDQHGPDIMMEPSDEDPELKGPLTLRNMPAKDEIFLQRLSDKLEKVTSGEDATPTVLKHSDDEDDGNEAESQAQKPDADVNSDEAANAEEDIPLKIRNTSSNFGKPFGQA